MYRIVTLQIETSFFPVCVLFFLSYCFSLDFQYIKSENIGTIVLFVILLEMFDFLTLNSILAVGLSYTVFNSVQIYCFYSELFLSYIFIENNFSFSQLLSDPHNLLTSQLFLSL